MTRQRDPQQPVVFRIDGRKVTSADDFYAEIGRAVNGPGGYFGRNLDALADCLRGGFGTPEDRPFEFLWDHSDLSRRNLIGARRGNHALFESLLGVFADSGVTLHLR